jgi:hypothetical protein
MRVIARLTASPAKRAARSSILLGRRVFMTAILAGGVAACGVTLPTPSERNVPPGPTSARAVASIRLKS